MANPNINININELDDAILRNIFDQLGRCDGVALGSVSTRFQGVAKHVIIDVQTFLKTFSTNFSAKEYAPITDDTEITAAELKQLVEYWKEIKELHEKHKSNLIKLLKISKFETLASGLVFCAKWYRLLFPEASERVLESDYNSREGRGQEKWQRIQTLLPESIFTVQFNDRRGRLANGQRR